MNFAESCFMINYQSWTLVYVYKFSVNCDYCINYIIQYYTFNVRTILLGTCNHCKRTKLVSIPNLSR